MLRKRVLCTGLILSAICFAQTTIKTFGGNKEERFVPKVMNYQGYLTDSLGVPYDTLLDMTFKIKEKESKFGSKSNNV